MGGCHNSRVVVNRFFRYLAKLKKNFCRMVAVALWLS